MKKYCLLLFCITASAVALGQGAIPNGSFENWKSGVYSQPENYNYSSNLEYAWLFIEKSKPFNLVKTTTSFHGAYALQLFTTTLGNDTIFGYFINKMPKEDDFSAWTGGLPYNQQPKGIKGYYKYNLANTDSATIIVVFSKKGKNLGSYIFNIGGVHSSYTPFNYIFTPPLLERGLSNNDVRAIAIDPSGNLWFGTNGGGVSLYSSKGWTTFTTSNGLVSDSINSIFIDDKGAKWFGTPSGVSKFNDTIWITYTTADGLACNKVNGIQKANNKMWFGTFGGGVSSFDGTTWVSYTTANGLVNDSIRPIRKDSQGNLWFGTVGGVSKFNGTSWTNFTTSEGLANNDVRHIQIDPNNNIWFATNGGGVSKYNGTNWTTITTADGLASNFVNKILIEPNGTKWFTTLGGGISRFDGTNWTTYNTANVLPSDSVRAIGFAQNGVKFFGTTKGVCKFDGSTWSTITKISSTTPDSVILAMASSNVIHDKSGVPGCELFVDSISFIGVESQPSWLNGDFESWSEVNVNTLDGWFNNSQSGQGVYRTTDKVWGNYAVELITYLGEKNGHPAANPGNISTGYYPKNCNNNCTIQGGLPYTSKKDTLTFYYKYFPSGAAFGDVSLTFKKDGNIIHQSGINLSATNSFKYVLLPFELTQTPDTVIITIQSSNWQDTLTSFVGSRLVIDELQFKSQPLPTTDNSEGISEELMNIYPNPASHSVYVSLLNPYLSYEYKIYNTIGILVKSGRITQRPQEISLSELCNGVYLFTLKSQKRTFSRKIVVVR